ncbi:hypothetical protein HAX54_053423 [Datura stramonium]|uniref:Uncharacterized protein n=1 Tax=Datura stramonium TaxID=4076 RepID=A0ABS8T1F9_DATST|nr:hypothetical protein [Datura stramonium]
MQGPYSPVSSPPTTDTPISAPSDSGALPPSSIGATPSGSPTESLNVASLNRFVVVGTAFVAIFATSLMF